MIWNSIPYPQAFERAVPGRFDAPWSQDFDIQVVSAEHDILRARLFTVEQCRQINRMAECHAYPHENRDQIDHGWTNIRSPNSLLGSSCERFTICFQIESNQVPSVGRTLVSPTWQVQRGWL
jgi:hypothetical protein